jgi:hypothetical protein
MTPPATAATSDSSPSRLDTGQLRRATATTSRVTKSASAERLVRPRFPSPRQSLGAADPRAAQVLLGSAVAALAVPAAVRSTQALPAVASESASPELGHRGLHGCEPWRLVEDSCRSDADKHPCAGPSLPGRQVAISYRSRSVRSDAELWLRGDDQDEDDAEHGPGANSISDATVQDAEKHAGVPLRSVRAGEVGQSRLSLDT